MIKNQRGRRNLNAYQRVELELKIKKIIAAEAKKNSGTRTDLLAKLPKGSPINTRDEIAKVADVSSRTVGTVEYIDKNGSEDTKAKARSGEISINEALRRTIPKPPDKKAEVRAAVKAHETFKQAVSDGDVVSISDISKDNENKATITQAFVDEIKFARHTMLSIMAERPDKMTDSLINAMTAEQANNAKRHLDDIISSAMRLSEKIREVHR